MKEFFVERYQKDELLGKLFQLANDCVKNYTWEKYCTICDMVSDWNREHEECEIFMCDISNREDQVVNGFMIEDESFYCE